MRSGKLCPCKGVGRLAAVCDTAGDSRWCAIPRPSGLAEKRYGTGLGAANVYVAVSRSDVPSSMSPLSCSEKLLRARFSDHLDFKT